MSAYPRRLLNPKPYKLEKADDKFIYECLKAARVKPNAPLKGNIVIVESLLALLITSPKIFFICFWLNVRLVNSIISNQTIIGGEMRVLLLGSNLRKINQEIHFYFFYTPFIKSKSNREPRDPTIALE